MDGRYTIFIMNCHIRHLQGLCVSTRLGSSGSSPCQKCGQECQSRRRLCASLCYVARVTRMMRTHRTKTPQPPLGVWKTGPARGFCELLFIKGNVITCSPPFCRNYYYSKQQSIMCCILPKSLLSQ